MIDLGNGQYQITNKGTGETRVVGAADLPKYGLSAPQPHDPIPGIVKAGVPVAGGMLGGAALSELGPAGIVGGAGMGGAAGQSLINLLERAMGGPTPQNVGQNAQSLGGAAAANMIGGAAGEGLGFLANPVRGLSGIVAKNIAKSTKAIDLDKLLQMFEGQAGGDAMAPMTKVGANIGMGPEAEAAFKNMVPRIKEVVNTAQPHLGNLTDVPVQIAQHLKQTIPDWGNVLQKITDSGASDMYAGGVKSPGLTVPKEFNSMLKSAIEQAVPGVKIPNALMHYLYTLPNFLESMTYALPRPVGRMARGIGGTVAGIPGKIIPEGGGLLKYLLQLGGQGIQQNAGQP